jgi:hypothetical protein
VRESFCRCPCVIEPLRFARARTAPRLLPINTALRPRSSHAPARPFRRTRLLVWSPRRQLGFTRLTVAPATRRCTCYSAPHLLTSPQLHVLSTMDAAADSLPNSMGLTSEELALKLTSELLTTPWRQWRTHVEAALTHFLIYSGSLYFFIMYTC